MPGGDRTGPRGLGSRTGRGMGYCSGYSVPGYMNVGLGFGRMGWGRGRGRGFYGYPAYPAQYPANPAYPAYPAGQYTVPFGSAPFSEPKPEEEMAYLEGVAKDIGAELKEIKDRIDELKK